jgi:ubiquinone/menaquinone biosynthesis C-methylase UbiE
MTDATRSQFTKASVPKAYDEFFVPRLFEPWAKLLLDEINLQSGETVLDIATGPGTVARLAAVRVPSLSGLLTQHSIENTTRDRQWRGRRFQIFNWRGAGERRFGSKQCPASAARYR